MLDDEALKEAIKEVKIEKALPSYFADRVERRYLDYRILRDGEEITTKFLQAVGPGPLNIDTWGYGIASIKRRAKTAGFLLVKNKRSRGYALYKEGKQEGEEFVFNPEMLDTEDGKWKNETTQPSK